MSKDEVTYILNYKYKIFVPLRLQVYHGMRFLGNTKRYSTYLRLKLHGGAIVSGAYSYYLRNRDEILKDYGYSS